MFNWAELVQDERIETVIRTFSYICVHSSNQTGIGCTYSVEFIESLHVCSLDTELSDMVEYIRQTRATTLDQIPNDRFVVPVVERHINNFHFQTFVLNTVNQSHIVQINFEIQCICYGSTFQFTIYTIYIFSHSLNRIANVVRQPVSLVIFFFTGSEQECICMIQSIISAFVLRELFFEYLDCGSCTTGNVRFQTCSLDVYSMRS